MCRQLGYAAGIQRRNCNTPRKSPPRSPAAARGLKLAVRRRGGRGRSSSSNSPQLPVPSSLLVPPLAPTPRWLPPPLTRRGDAGSGRPLPPAPGTRTPAEAADAGLGTLPSSTSARSTVCAAATLVELLLRIANMLQLATSSYRGSKQVQEAAAVLTTCDSTMR